MKLIDISTRKYPNTFAQVDDQDFEWLNQWKWYPIKGRHTLYASRSTIENGKKPQIHMHRLVARIEKPELCDHIDGNGLNNTRANLRSATVAENNRHIGKPKHGKTSRFKGVSRTRGENFFRALIRVSGKKIHLGCFTDEEGAARAYDLAARNYHGQFARYNFPLPPMLLPAHSSGSPAAGESQGARS